MLDIMLIAMMVVIFFVGVKKGAIIMIYNLLSFVASIMLTKYLAPYVSVFLNDKTYEYIKSKIIENLKIGEVTKETVQKNREIIENFEIPEFFKQSLLENNNTGVYEKLGITGIEDYIATFIATLAISISSIVITFIIVIILIKVVGKFLGIFNYIPVISTINRIIGGGIGVGIAYLVTNIVFLILPLNLTIYENATKLINESVIGMYIYENNIFYSLVNLLVVGIL